MSSISSNNSDFILYTSQDGEIRVDVFVNDETVWLTQKAIAELFSVDRSVITKHLKNIFDSKELDEISVCAKIAHTAADKKVYQTKYYNLDAIISLGYRVNSKQATQFRIWATKTLKEFIIKGFVLDDKRLKQGGQVFGKDYFEELLERIREIRASERRFYQKITDIFAQCSIDYDAQSELTLNFYKTVQNKLHWAITGKTAAEIIHNRVDSEKPSMGLTTWKNTPNGKILKSDIGVAKNYLEEKEIKELNRLVELYLNFAELQAERNIPMKMAEWIEILDGFLKINRYELLNDAGKISNEQAILKANKEFDKYRIIQDKKYISDFDKQINKIKKKIATQLKPLLSFLILLLQLQVFAQGATELKPWLPKLEAEYQGVYHFGESENEMDLILICTATKWYAQLVSGSFNAEGTKWTKHFENLKDVKITSNSFYCSSTIGKFVINTTSTENSKALQIQQLWNSEATQQIGNKTQSLQSYFNGKYAKASPQFLTKDDLSTYSKQDLKLMRNEIYARYGYKFKSGGEMDTYFKKQDWYTPQHENVDSFLTEIEKANSELILKAEQNN